MSDSRNMNRLYKEAIAQERKLRQSARQRLLDREERRRDLQKLCEQRRAEIDEVSTRPFSWQQGSAA